MLRAVLDSLRVRILDGVEGTSAKTRVMIDSSDGDEIWTTVGSSPNIIEASWQALADSFQFKLANEKQIRSRKYPAQEELPIFVKP